MKKNLIVILGPTASGKTKLAVKLAYELQGEIISADSRQVYRGMDIGTGKDLNDYIIGNKIIPCHLIDVVSPLEEFNLFEFQKKFYEVHQALSEKKIMSIMVGGTGLYLESVLAQYRLPPAPPNQELRNSLQKKSKEELEEILFAYGKKMHNTTDLEDKSRIIRAIEIEEARLRQPKDDSVRPVVNAVVIGISLSRATLRERITLRLQQRLRQGMIEEVANLRESGLSWEKLESFGLEYKFIAQYLQGKINYDEMFMKLNTGIHQFAKRQETWFRRMEKKGIEIKWIGGDDYELLKKIVNKTLQ